MATRLTWCSPYSGDFVLALFVILQLSFLVKFWGQLSCAAPLQYWMLGLTISLLLARLLQYLLRVSMQRTGVRVLCSCLYLLCAFPFSVVWTALGTYWYVRDLGQCEEHAYAKWLIFVCLLGSYLHSLYHILKVAVYVYKQRRQRVSVNPVTPLLPEETWRERASLSIEEINRIPEFLALEVTDNCAICLDPFTHEARIKKCPKCRKCYHSRCIDLSLQHRPGCPICRANWRDEYRIG